MSIMSNGKSAVEWQRKESEKLNGETVVSEDKDKALDDLIESLFTNGSGDKAERLCLYQADVYLGGWSRGPLRDRLADYVATIRREARAEAFREIRVLYDRVFVIKSTGDPDHPVQGSIDYDAKANFDAALERGENENV